MAGQPIEPPRQIKEAVCVAEMQILKRLGFNMQVRNSLVGVPLGKMGERLLS
jgi:hypothetical protein